MQKLEVYDVIATLGRLALQEKQCCERYCKLNPQATREREKSRDVYLLAIHSVQEEISKMIKK